MKFGKLTVTFAPAGNGERAGWKIGGACAAEAEESWVIVAIILRNRIERIGIRRHRRVEDLRCQIEAFVRFFQVIGTADRDLAADVCDEYVAIRGKYADSWQDADKDGKA